MPDKPIPDPAVAELYRSENGDVWTVIYDTLHRHVVIRHTANLSSGGHVAEMGIRDFLASDHRGPEHVSAARWLANHSSTNEDIQSPGTVVLVPRS